MAEALMFASADEGVTIFHILAGLFVPPLAGIALVALAFRLARRHGRRARDFR